MLIVSVLLSAVLVAIVYAVHAKEGTAVFWAALALILGTASSLLMCFLPAFWIHTLLVLLGTILWRSRQWSPGSLLTYMIVAATGIYGILSYQALRSTIQQGKLSEQYAFESIETRLPIARKTGPAKLSADAQKNLTEVGENVRRDYHRERMLNRLHQSSVISFISSPGFGIMRGPPPLITSVHEIKGRDETLLPQPGEPFSSTLSDEDIRHEPRQAGLGSLRSMHLNGVVDFVNPKGFGLFVARDKVTGFIAHQFSDTPSAESWKTQAIELVGLLMHDEPAVYMSNKLPRMDELRAAPIRPLNTFESAGLAKLRDGDDIFIRETGEGLRMLGAIRAIEQCINCHGGERGDLLGAFSYSLTRTSER